MCRPRRGLFDSLAHVALDIPVENTLACQLLPRRLVAYYDDPFLRRFLVAVIAVGQKLAGGEKVVLSSTAEELALHAITGQARELLTGGDGEGIEELLDEICEDDDVLLLFDPASDGIEDVGIPGLDLVNLHPDDWFRPFRPGLTVHPYLEEALG